MSTEVISMFVCDWKWSRILLWFIGPRLEAELSHCFLHCEWTICSGWG